MKQTEGGKQILLLWTGLDKKHNLPQSYLILYKMGHEGDKEEMRLDWVYFQVLERKLKAGHCSVIILLLIPSLLE